MNKKTRLLYRAILEQADEKGKQAAAAKDQEPFRLRRKKDVATPKNEEDEQGASAGKQLDTPTYDKVIDKLNLLRSGKSTKDSEVAAQVKKYFNSLSGPERVALYAYLTGLSEILSGAEEAKKVEDPSDSPYNVDTTRRGDDASQSTEAPKKKPSPGVQAAKSAKIVVGQ